MVMVTRVIANSCSELRHTEFHTDHPVLTCVGGMVGLMVEMWMTFGTAAKVGSIEVSRDPVESELTLDVVALEPLEVHVYELCLFGDNSVIGDSTRYVVVGLD